PPSELVFTVRPGSTIEGEVRGVLPSSVVVRLEGESLTAEPDETGHYRFTGVSGGIHIVEAAIDGDFESSHAQIVFVPLGRTTTVRAAEFDLAEDWISLDGPR